MPLPSRGQTLPTSTQQRCNIPPKNGYTAYKNLLDIFKNIIYFVLLLLLKRTVLKSMYLFLLNMQFLCKICFFESPMIKASNILPMQISISHTHTHIHIQTSNDLHTRRLQNYIGI